MALLLLMPLAIIALALGGIRTRFGSIVAVALGCALLAIGLDWLQYSLSHPSWPACVDGQPPTSGQWCKLPPRSPNTTLLSALEAAAIGSGVGATARRLGVVGRQGADPDSTGRRQTPNARYSSPFTACPGIAPETCVPEK